MRQILFRAKRLNGDGWVYGSLLQEDTGKTTIVPQSGPMEEVDPQTVGQYTGLDDKDGKKIWEGDLVDYDFDDYPSVRNIVKKCIFSKIRGEYMLTFVEYNDEQTDYIVRSKDYESLYYSIYGGSEKGWHNSAHVVGNIHDNPELLKSV